MASDMLKNILDNERKAPAATHGALFMINSKEFLDAPSHRQDSIYHGLLLHQAWCTEWNNPIRLQ